MKIVITFDPLPELVSVDTLIQYLQPAVLDAYRNAYQHEKTAKEIEATLKSAQLSGNILEATFETGD